MSTFAVIPTLFDFIFWCNWLNVVSITVCVVSVIGKNYTKIQFEIIVHVGAISAVLLVKRSVNVMDGQQCCRSFMMSGVR